MNADDSEAVVAACCIAADWRSRFKQDCVVDIVGYRRSALHSFSLAALLLMSPWTCCPPPLSSSAQAETALQKQLEYRLLWCHRHRTGNSDVTMHDSQICGLDNALPMYVVGSKTTFATATQSDCGAGNCRYGHNELDDPTITLPLSYQAVAQHPPVLQLYTDKLDKLGLLDSSEVHTWQVNSPV